MRRLRRLLALCALALSLALAVVPDASAQMPGASPDHATWETVAETAEDALQAQGTSNDRLLELRSVLVGWRDQFLRAESTNDNRIQTLRSQIAALGQPPEEGQTEAPEIAARRADLNKQLAEMLAPQRSAEEAYSRADGLIRGIDALLRERQASELLSLGPSPINPANLPQLVTEVATSLTILVEEVAANLRDPGQRQVARQQLPITLLFVAVAAVLLLRGRGWMEYLARQAEGPGHAAGRGLGGFLISFGQIILPLAGLVSLVAAVNSTGLTGVKSEALAQQLPVVGLVVLGFRWLGGRLVPLREERYKPLNVPLQGRREVRLHFTALGVLLAAAVIAEQMSEIHGYSEATQSTLGFPPLALTGLILIRLGQLMTRSARGPRGGGDTRLLRAATSRIVGRAVWLCGIAGPVSAAIGYRDLGQTLTYSAVLTLALIGFLLMMFLVNTDLYAMVARKSDEDAKAALWPVLLNFVLSILALPLLALIWGARPTDLTEVYARVREGFQLGDTRIQPGDFLTFLVVFAVLYGTTRAIQEVLRASVLPRTRLDVGGRNAIVAGTGYVGIFAAAMFAITSAGIDLTALGYIAGALSLGIGFGLQNVVSNFVSGIILLIERPISEGDWIEVGGQMGYVRDISVRSTRIETFDKTDVIVPNADFVSGTVTNFTRGNLIGRVIVPVGVAYGTDTRLVERILTEIAHAHPLVTVEPPPAVLFIDFGDSSLNFEIRAVLSDVNFALSAHSDMNHEIARRFSEEGIEIPFPQRDLWFRNPGGGDPGNDPPPSPPDAPGDAKTAEKNSP